MGKSFLGILSTGRLNLWAKYSKPKNKIKIFFFSKLQELEVRICVHPNFPIVILILLNRFHNFAISMGPSTCVGKPPSTSSGRYLLNIHFFIELDQKVIKFNIQFKFKSKFLLKIILFNNLVYSFKKYSFLKSRIFIQKI